MNVAGSTGSLRTRIIYWPLSGIGSQHLGSFPAVLLRSPRISMHVLLEGPPPAEKNRGSWISSVHILSPDW